MEVVRAAAFLSSGTLATLTGLRKYDDLHKVQADFTAFCAANAGKFKNWPQAWEAFKQVQKLAAGLGSVQNRREAISIRRRE